MSNPDSEKRPEKYSRDDIRPISTLELWDDEEKSAEGEDRIVVVSRSSEWPTHRTHPDSEIECCRHDDPGKCDIDARSDDERWATSKGEYIGKQCEYREHDDERHTDIEIAPRYEPDECESDSKREESECSITHMWVCEIGYDLRKIFLRESRDRKSHYHESSEYPGEIYHWPYGESDPCWCDWCSEHIRYICLGLASDEVGRSWDTHKWSESYSDESGDEEDEAHK